MNPFMEAEQQQQEQVQGIYGLTWAKEEEEEEEETSLLLQSLCGLLPPVPGDVRGASNGPVPGLDNPPLPQTLLDLETDLEKETETFGLPPTAPPTKRMRRRRMPELEVESVEEMAQRNVLRSAEPFSFQRFGWTGAPGAGLPSPGAPGAAVEAVADADADSNHTLPQTLFRSPQGRAPDPGRGEGGGGRTPLSEYDDGPRPCPPRSPQRLRLAPLHPPPHIPRSRTKSKQEKEEELAVAEGDDDLLLPPPPETREKEEEEEEEVEKGDVGDGSFIVALAKRPDWKQALEEGHYEELFDQYGLDVTERTRILKDHSRFLLQRDKHWDGQGDTMLHQAIREGDVCLALVLLDAGAWPLMPDWEERSPLELAREYVMPQVVQACLDRLPEPWRTIAERRLGETPVAAGDAVCENE